MPSNFTITATPATVPATGGTVALHVGYQLAGGKSARVLHQELVDETGQVIASSTVNVPAVPGEAAPTIVGLAGTAARPPAGQYGVRSSDGTQVQGSGQDLTVVVPAS